MTDMNAKEETMLKKGKTIQSPRIGKERVRQAGIKTKAKNVKAIKNLNALSFSSDLCDEEEESGSEKYETSSNGNEKGNRDRNLADPDSGRINYTRIHRNELQPTEDKTSISASNTIIDWRPESELRSGPGSCTQETDLDQIFPKGGRLKVINLDNEEAGKKYGRSRGRGVITTSILTGGETVIEEDAYVSVLYESSLHNRCGNCYRIGQVSVKKNININENMDENGNNDRAIKNRKNAKDKDISAVTRTNNSSLGLQLKRCSSCKNIYYCSIKCQHQDWEQHKMECKIYSRLLKSGTKAVNVGKSEGNGHQSNEKQLTRPSLLLSLTEEEEATLRLLLRAMMKQRQYVLLSENGGDRTNHDNLNNSDELKTRIVEKLMYRGEGNAYIYDSKEPLRPQQKKKTGDAAFMLSSRDRQMVRVLTKLKKLMGSYEFPQGDQVIEMAKIIIKSRNVFVMEDGLRISKDGQVFDGTGEYIENMRGGIDGKGAKYSSGDARKSDGGYGLGMFVRSSFINHSCAPLCIQLFSGKKIVIKAGGDGGYLTKTAKNNKKLGGHSGAEVTIGYIDIRMGYKQRQEYLKRQFGFECSCMRCKVEKKMVLYEDNDKEVLCGCGYGYGCVCGCGAELGLNVDSGCIKNSGDERKESSAGGKNNKKCREYVRNGSILRFIREQIAKIDTGGEYNNDEHENDEDGEIQIKYCEKCDGYTQQGGLKQHMHVNKKELERMVKQKIRAAIQNYAQGLKGYLPLNIALESKANSCDSYNRVVELKQIYQKVQSCIATMYEFLSVQSVELNKYEFHDIFQLKFEILYQLCLLLIEGNSDQNQNRKDNSSQHDFTSKYNYTSSQSQSQSQSEGWHVYYKLVNECAKQIKYYYMNNNDSSGGDGDGDGNGNGDWGVANEAVLRKKEKIELCCPFNRYIEYKLLYLETKIVEHQLQTIENSFGKIKDKKEMDIIRSEMVMKYSNLQTKINKYYVY